MMEYKYTFTYFSRQHIYFLIYALLLFIVFNYIHTKIDSEKMSTYMTVLGIAIIILKLFDSFNLYYTEYKPALIFLPLHVCNISLISGALYLITKRKIFFNILYFFSFGAIIALLVPDFKSYNTFYYPYIYYTTHTLEYILVVFGLRIMNLKIDKKGFYQSAVVLAILFILSLIVNKQFLDTNFMFISNYAIPELKFVKPFILYRLLVIAIYYFSIYIMYLLSKEKRR